jgi:flagellar biosynthetic protein FliR
MEIERVAYGGLLLVRPGMLVMSAPPFGGTFAPSHVRIGLVVLLAAAMWPAHGVPAIGSGVGLAMVVAREIAIGLAIGVAMRALLAGAEMAGHLTSQQIGLSYGAIVDPQSGVRNNILASLYGNLTLVTFLALNGHHALVRALAASYQALPIGPGGLDQPSLARAISQMLGIVFVLGVRFAMPAIVALLVVELAMGLISRTAPALNLMVVGMPLRLVSGLLVVIAVVPALPGVVRRFSSLVIDVGAVLAGAFQ